MPVDVNKATARRVVRYDTLQDLLADAERLASGPVRTAGNRSFAEILRHLSVVMHGSIDSWGEPIYAPFGMRVLGRLFRKAILARGLPSGVRLRPEDEARVWPSPGGVVEELDGLRAAIRRLGEETKRGSHPVFGKLNVDQWNRFHLRHSELHMSFVVPA